MEHDRGWGVHDAFSALQRARPVAALALAAAFGLAAPWSILRVWWPLRHGDAGSDPGSQFVARAEALGASLPLAPVAFVSDSTDLAERGLHYCLVQHALAPRRIEDVGADVPRLPGCRPAIGWFPYPARAREFGARSGVRIVADAGQGLVLLEACQ